MYDELINRLRDIARSNRNIKSNYIGLSLLQAADAIEELIRKEKFHAFLWNIIQPNEMEQYLAMFRAQAVPSEVPKEE